MRMKLIRSLTKRRIRPGKFNCEIGKVEAKIVRLFEERNLDSPLHNFRGDYSVVCQKMNLEHQDDGGCFCVTTNAPGTCKASLNSSRKIGQYTYKWCPYLPEVEYENYNPIALKPSARRN